MDILTLKNKMVIDSIEKRLGEAKLTQEEIMADIKKQVQSMDRLEAVYNGLKVVNIDDVIRHYQSQGYAYKNEKGYLFYDNDQLGDLSIDHHLSEKETKELQDNRAYYIPLAEHISVHIDIHHLPLQDRLEIAYLLNDGGDYDTKDQLFARFDDDELSMYAKSLPDDKMKTRAFLVLKSICGIDIESIRNVANRTEKMAEIIDGTYKNNPKRLNNIQK